MVALVVLFGFSGSLGVNAFVPPDEALGLGLASMSSTHALGPLSLQLAAEAEWDLHDATLVPLDVALLHNVAPTAWLSFYGGLATHVTVERLVSGVETAETSFGFAAALRAGASAQLNTWLSIGLDLEYAVPLRTDPTPEMIVELGPSIAF